MMNPFGGSSSDTSTSTTSTTSGSYGIGKIMFIVFIIAILSGGIAAAVVLTKSSSSDDPADPAVPSDPPVVPQTVLEIASGSVFGNGSKKMVGTDGSTANITNDILTIVAQDGVTEVTFNGVTSIDFQEELVEIKYSNASIDRTILFNGVYPTSLTVKDGQLVFVSGDTIVWKQKDGNVLDFEQVVLTSDFPLEIQSISTVSVPPIYVGSYTKESYCQGKTYTQFEKQARYTYDQTSEVCNGYMKAGTVPASIQPDRILQFPDVIGPDVGTDIAIDKFTAIKTESGNIIRPVGIGNGDYKIVLIVDAADDNEDEVLLNAYSTKLPVYFDVQGGALTFTTIAPTTVSTIKCWGSNFQDVTLPLTPVAFDFKGNEITYGVVDGQIYVAPSDSTTSCIGRNAPGSSLAYGTIPSGVDSTGCYADVVSPPAPLKPDANLVFKYMKADKLYQADIDKIKDTSTPYESTGFEYDIDGNNFIRIGWDDYFYIHDKVASTMTKQNLEVADLKMHTSYDYFKFTLSGVNFYGANDSIIAIQSWDSTTPTPYDATGEKQIYLGESTDCSALANGTGLTVVSTTNAKCYGKVTGPATSDSVSWPLLFPTEFTSLTDANNGKFDITSKLTVAGSSTDFIYKDSFGVLHRSTATSAGTTTVALGVSMADVVEEIAANRKLVASSTGLYILDDNNKYVKYAKDNEHEFIYLDITFNTNTIYILSDDAPSEAIDCYDATSNVYVGNTDSAKMYKDGSCILKFTGTELLLLDASQVFYKHVFNAGEKIGVSSFVDDEMPDTIVEGKGFHYRFTDTETHLYTTGSSKPTTFVDNFKDVLLDATTAQTVVFDKDSISFFDASNTLVKYMTKTTVSEFSSDISKTGDSILFGTLTVEECGLKSSTDIMTAIIGNECYGKISGTGYYVTNDDFTLFPDVTLTQFSQGDQLYMGSVLDVKGYKIGIIGGTLIVENESGVRYTPTNATGVHSFEFNPYPKLLDINGVVLWPDTPEPNSYSDMEFNILEQDGITLYLAGGDNTFYMYEDGTTKFFGSTQGRVGDIYLGKAISGPACQTLVNNINYPEYKIVGDAAPYDCYTAGGIIPGDLNNLKYEPRLFPTKTFTKFTANDAWVKGSQLTDGNYTVVFDDRRGKILTYENNTIIKESNGGVIGSYVLSLDKVSGATIKTGSTDILSKGTSGMNVRKMVVGANGDVFTQNSVGTNIQSIHGDNPVYSNIREMNPSSTSTTLPVFINGSGDVELCEDLSQLRGFDTYNINKDNCYASLSKPYEKTLPRTPYVFPSSSISKLEVGDTLTENGEIRVSDSVRVVLTSGSLTIWSDDGYGNWISRWTTGDLGITRGSFNTTNGPTFFDKDDVQVFPAQIGTVNYGPTYMSVNSSYQMTVYSADLQIMRLEESGSVTFLNGAGVGTRTEQSSEIGLLEFANSVYVGEFGTTDCKVQSEQLYPRRLDDPDPLVPRFSIKDSSCYASIASDATQLSLERVLFVDGKYTRVIGEYQLRIKENGPSKGGMNLIESDNNILWTSHASDTDVTINSIVDDTSATRATILLKDDEDKEIWPTFTDQNLATSYLEYDAKSSSILVKNSGGNTIISFGSDGVVPVYSTVASRNISKVQSFTDLYDVEENGTLPMYLGTPPSDTGCSHMTEYYGLDQYYWSSTKGCYGIINSPPTNIIPIEINLSKTTITGENTEHNYDEVGGEKVAMKNGNLYAVFYNEVFGVRLNILTKDPNSGEFALNISHLFEMNQSVADSGASDISIASDGTGLDFNGYEGFKLPYGTLQADTYTLAPDGDFQILDAKGDAVWSTSGRGQYVIGGDNMTITINNSSVNIPEKSYHIESLVAAIDAASPNLSVSIIGDNRTQLQWSVTDGKTVDLERGLFKYMYEYFGLSGTELTKIKTTRIMESIPNENPWIYITDETSDKKCQLDAYHQNLYSYKVIGTRCYGGFNKSSTVRLLSHDQKPLFPQEFDGLAKFESTHDDGTTYTMAYSSAFGSFSFFINGDVEWSCNVGTSGTVSLFEGDLWQSHEEGYSNNLTRIHDALGCDSLTDTEKVNCETWVAGDWVVTADGLESSNGLWRVGEFGLVVRPVVYDSYSLLHMETSTIVSSWKNSYTSGPTASIVSDMAKYHTLSSHEPFIIHTITNSIDGATVKADVAFTANKAAYGGSYPMPKKTNSSISSDGYYWSDNSCSVTFGTNEKDGTEGIVGSAVLANGDTVCTLR